MHWFKANILIGKTRYTQYFEALSEIHARFQLCAKYGQSISDKAEITDLGRPTFNAYEVQIQFRQRIEKEHIMAIEKEHVQSMIYRKYRKKEIIKLIIHGKDDYGGP
jgi:hypothetical protein